MKRLTAPDPHGIAAAAQALREGLLVVFPTETVYGLGANALDARAVRRVFEAKGRPADNPLIVHCPDVAAARGLAASWPDSAEALAKAFWPGPLTLVLPRAAGVPDEVTAGLDSVALRVPAHPVAQALLRAAGVPVAAPSANRSGRPSPTRCADARADLGEAVEVYLDGGPTAVGLESTVVSLLGKRPALLRLGGVPREAIESHVGPLEDPSAGGPVRSPGMKYRHYAPRATVLLGPPGLLEAMAADQRAAGVRTAVLCSTETALAGPDVRVVGGRGDGAAWAHAIFSLMRDLDAAGYGCVVVEEIPEHGLGAAVMERLRKAAAGDASAPR
jgi:L-threonylcarbamoyladenylate synthase